MSRARYFAPLLIVLSLVLIACSKAGGEFVGSYSVKQALSKEGEKLNNKTAPPAVQKQMAQAQVGLVLNADRTAALSMSGMGNPMNIPGTWEYKEGLVLVTLTPPGGAGAGPPMELVPSEDKKSLVTGGSQFGSLTFSKN